MVGRGVLRFKKGVCSKRVSGSVVLEAFSSRARFICTTVVQIGVAQQTPQGNTTATGTVAAGQQRPCAPTTAARTALSR